MSFDNMGKPIPSHKKDNAIKEVIKMGLTKDEAVTVVNKVSFLLEKDKPSEAMEASKEFIDLTGSYMLFSFLLVDENKSYTNS